MITKASDNAAMPAFAVAVWRAPLLLMALLLLTELGGAPVRALFGFDRTAIEAGQWWRLLTANFVHLGWYHWFLNELGLVVLVLLCPERIRVLTLLARVAFIGILMSLCLYGYTPGLSRYVGMSGVIHGLFVLGLLPQVRQRDLVSMGCLAFLIGKLVFEQIAGAPLSDESAIGGHVVTESHLFGALAAALYAALDAGRARIARRPAS